jgi:translation elongation factor EF-Tu-like GTPase
MKRPTVTVDVVFLSAAEGGRQLPPGVNQRGLYRPHLVIQDRTVRRATLDEKGVANEEYLGVVFLEGPDQVRFGEPARCLLELVYFPAVLYVGVESGATFTVREGAAVVGQGVVLERADPPADATRGAA